jgi:hypothetical protein
VGGFYYSIQNRGADRSAVKDALEHLAQKKKIVFLLGPKLGDWVGVYPDAAGQDLQIGRRLARKLLSEQFELVVHDDDVFAYEYLSRTLTFPCSLGLHEFCCSLRYLCCLQFNLFLHLERIWSALNKS